MIDYDSFSHCHFTDFFSLIHVVAKELISMSSCCKCSDVGNIAFKAFSFTFVTVVHSHFKNVLACNSM